MKLAVTKKVIVPFGIWRHRPELAFGNCSGSPLDLREKVIEY
jgi:hypothetical protein